MGLLRFVCIVYSKYEGASEPPAHIHRNQIIGKGGIAVLLARRVLQIGVAFGTVAVERHGYRYCGRKAIFHIGYPWFYRHDVAGSPEASATANRIVRGYPLYTPAQQQRKPFGEG